MVLTGVLFLEYCLSSFTSARVQSRRRTPELGVTSQNKAALPGVYVAGDASGDVSLIAIALAEGPKLLWLSTAFYGLS